MFRVVRARNHRANHLHESRVEMIMPPRLRMLDSDLHVRAKQLRRNYVPRLQCDNYSRLGLRSLVAPRLVQAIMSGKKTLLIIVGLMLQGVALARSMRPPLQRSLATSLSLLWLFT